MPYGNEPGGAKHAAYLAKWVGHYRARDPRRLYTSGAGWPQIPENQFHVTPDPRIQGWGEGLNSRINARPPETITDYRDYVASRQVPVISHEIGQWCVYPNFDEIPKYTGYLKPGISRSSATRSQPITWATWPASSSSPPANSRRFVTRRTSSRLLRTPGMGGFQLLDLHDFPGQGHGAGRRPGSVLGIQRLRHRRRIQPVLQSHRAAGPPGQARFHH